ncbi:caveolin-3-like [Pomacea canaliculata]|uniref:caveolin-3-like n=1 Tax=Pomacea canaliculata TaxID=400727 RepID=UPI000D7309A4|nr:caveolin-3-like [Pomacea canaliculata]
MEETSTAMGLDLKDRDPKRLNDSIKVRFEDIFAEPNPAAFSFDDIWQTTFKVFNITRLWCYRVLSLILAVPAACVWGVHFALLAFCTVWCCRPFMRWAQIVCGYCGDCHLIFIENFVKPVFVAVSFIFANFKVVSFVRTSGRMSHSGLSEPSGFAPVSCLSRWS